MRMLRALEFWEPGFRIFQHVLKFYNKLVWTRRDILEGGFLKILVFPSLLGDNDDIFREMDGSSQNKIEYSIEYLEAFQSFILIWYRSFFQNGRGG